MLYSSTHILFVSVEILVLFYFTAFSCFSFKLAGKTIHVMNKNEHALSMAEPVHDLLGGTNGPTEDNASVKKRTNVLLLGDHIGDLRMSDGLNYENRISVGFL